MPNYGAVRRAFLWLAQQLFCFLCAPNSFLGYGQCAKDHLNRCRRCLPFHERVLRYRRWSSRPRSIYNVIFSDWEGTRFFIPSWSSPRLGNVPMYANHLLSLERAKVPFFDRNRCQAIGVGIQGFCCKVSFSAKARHYSRFRTEAKLGCETLLWWKWNLQFNGIFKQFFKDFFAAHWLGFYWSKASTASILPCYLENFSHSERCRKWKKGQLSNGKLLCDLYTCTFIVNG